MIDITFNLLHTSHFPLLLKWLESPHVKKWWDQDITHTLSTVTEKYTDYVEGCKKINGERKPIKAFIIALNKQPIGYIQLYNAYDFPRSKPLTGLPENLGAFDLFIGEEMYLGRGIGVQVLTTFLTEYAKEYNYLFADPDVNNVSAFKTYERTGFKTIATHLDVQEMWMLRGF